MLPQPGTLPPIIAEEPEETLPPVLPDIFQKPNSAVSKTPLRTPTMR